MRVFHGVPSVEGTPEKIRQWTDCGDSVVVFDSTEEHPSENNADEEEDIFDCDNQFSFSIKKVVQSPAKQRTPNSPIIAKKCSPERNVAQKIYYPVKDASIQINHKIDFDDVGDLTMGRRLNGESDIPISKMATEHRKAKKRAAVQVGYVGEFGLDDLDATPAKRPRKNDGETVPPKQDPLLKLIPERRDITEYDKKQNKTGTGPRCSKMSSGEKCYGENYTECVSPTVNTTCDNMLLTSATKIGSKRTRFMPNIENKVPEELLNNDSSKITDSYSSGKCRKSSKNESQAKPLSDNESKNISTDSLLPTTQEPYFPDEVMILSLGEYLQSFRDDENWSSSSGDDCSQTEQNVLKKPAECNQQSVSPVHSIKSLAQDDESPKKGKGIDEIEDNSWNVRKNTRLERIDNGDVVAHQAEIENDKGSKTLTVAHEKEFSPPLQATEDRNSSLLPKTTSGEKLAAESNVKEDHDFCIGSEDFADDFLINSGKLREDIQSNKLMVERSDCCTLQEKQQPSKGLITAGMTTKTSVEKIDVVPTSRSSTAGRHLKITNGFKTRNGKKTSCDSTSTLLLDSTDNIPEDISEVTKTDRNIPYPHTNLMLNDSSCSTSRCPEISSDGFKTARGETINCDMRKCVLWLDSEGSSDNKPERGLELGMINDDYALPLSLEKAFETQGFDGYSAGPLLSRQLPNTQQPAMEQIGFKTGRGEGIKCDMSKCLLSLDSEELPKPETTNEVNKINENFTLPPSHDRALKVGTHTSSERSNHLRPTSPNIGMNQMGFKTGRGKSIKCDMSKCLLSLDLLEEPVETEKVENTNLPPVPRQKPSASERNDLLLFATSSPKVEEIGFKTGLGKSINCDMSKCILSLDLEEHEKTLEAGNISRDHILPVSRHKALKLGTHTSVERNSHLRPASPNPETEQIGFKTGRGKRLHCDMSKVISLDEEPIAPEKRLAVGKINRLPLSRDQAPTADMQTSAEGNGYLSPTSLNPEIKQIGFKTGRGKNLKCDMSKVISIDEEPIAPERTLGVGKINRLPLSRDQAPTADMQTRAEGNGYLSPTSLNPEMQQMGFKTGRGKNLRCDMSKVISLDEEPIAPEKTLEVGRIKRGTTLPLIAQQLPSISLERNKDCTTTRSPIVTNYRPNRQHSLDSSCTKPETGYGIRRRLTLPKNTMSNGNPSKVQKPSCDSKPSSAHIHDETSKGEILQLPNDLDSRLSVNSKTAKSNNGGHAKKTLQDSKITSDSIVQIPNVGLPDIIEYSTSALRSNVAAKIGAADRTLDDNNVNNVYGILDVSSDNANNNKPLNLIQRSRSKRFKPGGFRSPRPVQVQENGPTAVPAIPRTIDPSVDLNNDSDRLAKDKLEAAEALLRLFENGNPVLNGRHEVTDGKCESVKNPLEQNNETLNSTLNESLWADSENADWMDNIDKSIACLERYTWRGLLPSGPKRPSDVDLEDVSVSTLNVTIDNASEFVVEIPGAPLRTTKIGNFALKSSRYSTAGLHEFKKAFLGSDGVNHHVIPPWWFEHHYPIIVWKLANLERICPYTFAGRTLNASNMLDQLQHRYHREYVKKESSCVKRIFYGMGSPSLPMVLYIQGIEMREKYIDLVLSDGWYACHARCDHGLKPYIENKKVVFGTKIMTVGAEVIGPLGQTPLGKFGSAYLKITTNSTRRVSWPTKLGFFPMKQHPSVGIRSIIGNGGQIHCIKAVVARIYQRRCINDAMMLDHCKRQIHLEGRSTGDESQTVIDTSLRQSLITSMAVDSVLRIKLVEIDDHNICTNLLWWNPEDSLELVEGTTVKLYNILPNVHQLFEKVLALESTEKSFVESVPFSKPFSNRRKVWKPSMITQQTFPDFQEYDVVGLVVYVDDTPSQRTVYITDEIDGEEAALFAIIFDRTLKDSGFDDVVKTGEILAFTDILYTPEVFLGRVPSGKAYFYTTIESAPTCPMRLKAMREVGRKFPPDIVPKTIAQYRDLSLLLNKNFEQTTIQSSGVRINHRNQSSR